MQYTLQPKESRANLEATAPPNTTRARFTCSDPAWAHVVYVLGFKKGNVDTMIGGMASVSTFDQQPAQGGQRYLFALRSGIDVPVTVELVFS